MLRYQNPKLTDQVTRVGRTPIRKLQKNDRLVGPFFTDPTITSSKSRREKNYFQRLFIQ